MAKWIANVQIDDPKEYVDPKKFKAYVEDYGYEVEFEVSVVKEDNKSGINSYGQAGDDKIVIAEDVLDGLEEDVQGTLAKWKKKAEAMAAALNEKEL